MKKFKVSAILLFATLLMFSACGGGGGGSDDPGNPGDNPVLTYTLPGGTEFEMIITPDISITKTFPIRTDDSGLANVPAQFIMGETEVTYQLWIEVYVWATDANRGSKKYTIPKMSMSHVSSNTNNHPVIGLNWQASIVWCNALTEYYNANNGSAADLECVYYTDAGYTTPLRISSNDTLVIDTTAGSQDKPYIYAASKGNTNMANCTAKGFRLPTSIEWEYVARYIGTTIPSYTNYVLKDGIYYSKGNSASGAIGDTNDELATLAVAVYGISSAAVVKSKTGNSLGLYDMSGNVFEWCFNWDPDYEGLCRVLRGSSFAGVASNMQVGSVICSNPYVERDWFGFRFCRNK